jgi:formylglycine-generating enzyme required for sulfatase activity/serine/threonine protein kinase
MTVSSNQANYLATGSRIDQLRITRLLGQGSFAVSYLAIDTLTQRECVLKEYLPPQLAVRQADGSLRAANPEADAGFRQGIQEFLAEGRIQAGLEHPNIVEVTRCFEAHGTAYLQMPYVPGSTLSELMERQGPLDAGQIKSLLLPLLDALEYLHQHSVIHQDIKPSNIYLTGTGTPLLLDFGAAHQARKARIQDMGSRLGSPGYAAPEQESGSGAIGPWTDIYGLAASLYRLIGNRVPVTALQRMEAISSGLPDPLPPLTPAHLQHLPDGWLQAINQGLKLAADQRPQSVREWSRAFAEPSVRTRRSVLSDQTQPPAEEVDTEGRAWLPLVLVGVFALGLLVLVLYLFSDTFNKDQNGPQQEVASPRADERQSGAPSSRDPELNRRWQEALEADTIYAYQLFRQDYPNSIHEAGALQHLSRLDDALWQASDAEGSRSAYESYLQQLPQGRHVAEAMIRLDVLDRTAAEAERQQNLRGQQDNLAWNEARTQRSIAALDQYIAEFPDGQHLDAANSLRRQLSDAANDSSAFAAAQKLNTRKSYQAYIDAFPRGQNVTAALEAIDGLTLRPGKRFRDCEQCPNLVVVPSGSFLQGAHETSRTSLANEKPQRTVVIARAFAMGIHEVTMAQWQACVSDGPCQPVDDNGWGRGARPVMMVSWNDAQAYLEWLSKKTGERYRLPSESEWEYAARAGETAEWPDDNPAGVCKLANIAGSETGFRWAHAACADSHALETALVGSFLSNMFGLHDTLGNVAEWTLDCMSLSYSDAPADGSANSRGLCNSRVTRGGSWFSGARESRLSARFSLKAGDRNDFTGFRVLRELPDSS